MVIAPSVSAAPRRFDPLLIPAFFAVYILWGTTFLAIRDVVRELPPLFSAGTRFLIAGVVLYVFMRAKGQPRPRAIQWRNLSILGVVMFAAEYGPVFWAEKYVPSGVTSVLQATVPLITILLEVYIFRTLQFRWSLMGAASLGFCGVAVLLLCGGPKHFDVLPGAAILGGAVAWSLGSVLTRSMDLPNSKPLAAGAAMMLGGVGLFGLSLMFGELHTAPHISLRAGMALLYLIVCGSLLGFTAFVWLLARMPASRVSSHAYVNPIVAVALGYFEGGETITWKMLAGAALVLISVVLILLPRSRAGKLKQSAVAGNHGLCIYSGSHRRGSRRPHGSGGGRRRPRK